MCGIGRNNNGNGNGNEIDINTKNNNNVNGINNNAKFIPSTKIDNNVLINLDQGDPKMYIPFWKKVDEKCTVTIKASDLMSYFAEDGDTDVFYQMSEFTNAVKRVHRVVGNAVVDDRYIVSGTGSSQLFTVALKALASTVPNNNGKERIPVVCAEPFYSCYAEGLEAGKSEAFQWLGDANKFNKDGPYIEVVTTPNNPDGFTREAVVNKEGGMVICDLAYYWPQYTPITGPADYDIMLFTMSKTTGHAGSRVGWAIVKDKEIAMAMVKMMTLDTIGTCHEGQLRAAKILDFVADIYQDSGSDVPSMGPKGFFEFGSRVLAERWSKLRNVVNACGAFSLPDFPSEFCNFNGVYTEPNPAYAWMELKSGGDAAKLMSELKIRTRCGTRFGVSSRYTRINMMESDESFNVLLERLSTIKTE